MAVPVRVQGIAGTMSAFGDGVRAAVLTFAGPAFAQASRVKEPPPRPPLDIKPALKNAKPAKAARAKAKTPKPTDAPTGPTLASASSTAVTLPAVANPAAAPMMPDLKPSLTPEATPRRSVTRAELDTMIAKHAEANGVPEALVHRVVIRESRYHPGIVGRGGCYGLMQIKHGTARAMGYTGHASGLLDADTNLTYGVKYLAGAYRKANGDERRAVGYYVRGY
jgi:soluble lytic murein transglycosylase-like protein